MVGLTLFAQEAGGESVQRNPTILVVDDEPDIRRAVKDVLEATLGAQVYVAASAAEGLQMMDEHAAIQLIVSDYKMPGMNGIEFLRRVGKTHPSVPAVLITAFERELLESVDAHEVARTVLTKPINPRPMVQLIKRLLAESNT